MISKLMFWRMQNINFGKLNFSLQQEMFTEYVRRFEVLKFSRTRYINYGQYNEKYDTFRICV